MTFPAPDALTAMHEAIADGGDGGDCWEVIGPPLDAGVAGATAFDPGLTSARAELGGLHWGRIEADAARLAGLAAAIDNVRAALRGGRQAVAHDWTGRSFDAFQASVERVEQTLEDYSAAVRAAGDGLRAAMSSIRTQYASFRDNSLRILAFDGYTGAERDAIEGKLEEWHRAAAALKAGVGDAYRAALDDLRVLADGRVLSTMAVPGSAGTSGPAGPAGSMVGQPGEVGQDGALAGSAGSAVGRPEPVSPTGGATGAAGYAGPDWGAPGSAALGHQDTGRDGGPGEASLASASDDAPGQPPDAPQAAAGGGMPVLGGLGGVTAGGDTGRVASAWRVRGELFGAETGPATAAGAIGAADGEG